MRTWLLTALLLLGLAPAADAATYYVRTNGNNGNAGTANTPGGAWLTVGFAVDNVAAGDTIRVQAGTYSELPSPSDNGTAGNPVTLVADGTVNLCGLDFSGNSYIRVIGFVLSWAAGGCATRERTVVLAGVNTKLEFWNNTLSRGTTGFGMSALNDRCNGCIFFGNLGTNINVPDEGRGGGGFLCCAFNDTLVAYNNIGPIDPDAFQFQGVQNRFLNNYLHEVNQLAGHSDFWQTDAHDLGTSYTLAEGNFQWGVGNLSDEHIGVIQNLSPGQCFSGTCGPVTDNVWRRNVFFNVSGGLGVSYGPVATMLNTRYYSNTEVDTVQYPVGSTQEYSTNFANGVNYVFLRNNLAWQAWGTGITTNITVYYSDAVNNDIDYNLAYDPDGAVTFGSFWSNQVHEQSNVNPNFVNKTGRDFHLAAGSGDGANARGTGGPLTTATSCSGTTVNLATRGGGFFRGDNTTLDQYGGELVIGDTIMVGNSQRVIASVSGDVLTLTASVTCSGGDGVALGDDATPDLGAFPYKAGGYTLTGSYVLAGGTVTVTPNDASLVRLIVVYENGVPICADSTAPFACGTVGAGTLTVRMYNRFASIAPLWVDATNTDISGEPRLRLR
jgi:hypothetical protein